MKKTLRYMLMLVASFALLTACQDKYEVGDLLYPEEVADPTPRLYVYTPNISGFDQTITVPDTPGGVVLPSQTITFSVLLNKPVDHDVVVNLKESPALAAEFNAEADALPEGTVTFEPATLTIPAGAKETSEPVVVSITNAQALTDMGETGVIALTFDSDDTAVKTSTSNGAIYWTINKEFTNLYQGDLSAATEIPKTEWAYTYANCSYITEMFDGSISSWNYGTMRMGTGYVQFDFTTPRAIAGFGYLTPQNMSYWKYGFGRFQLYTSDDGDNWDYQGAAVLETITANNQWRYVQFYTPITARYYKIQSDQRSDGNKVVGNSVYVGELKIFE